MPGQFGHGEDIKGWHMCHWGKGFEVALFVGNHFHVTTEPHISCFINANKTSTHNPSEKVGTVFVSRSGTCEQIVKHISGKFFVWLDLALEWVTNASKRANIRLICIVTVMDMTSLVPLN